MIKISPMMTNNIHFKRQLLNTNFVSIAAASSFVEKGNRALNENRFSDALNDYKQALANNPDDINIYKKLGKAYQNLKDYQSAEEHYKTYLAQKPEDDEIWIDLGEVQRQSGRYNNALKSFERAKEINPKNDLANRSLLETKNNILSIYSPQRALEEKQQKANENLRAALSMTVNYLSPEFMKDLADVQVLFGETASMGGTANIAQYENSKKTITVSDSYIYAAPQVIAAYITHESIHAKDKDGYTSVYEEQDAYEVATDFWIKHSDGVEDPEMDYAASLYKRSPEILRNRVEEIYMLRDPEIAATSPNHPPDKKVSSKNKKKVASQPIKPNREYQIIA